MKPVKQRNNREADERRRRLLVYRRRESLSGKVARLRRMIANGYQATKNGLSGLSSGTVKHQFIAQKMENMERYWVQLEELVEQKKATQILNETLIQL